MVVEREKKDEIDLKGIIAREIASAETDNTERAKRQADALRYYQGEMPDVAAEKGRSSVVSRDLADTMGWMLPGIIRVFTASDHMAVAEPVGPEDQDGAAQATDGINYVFWKDNNGYKIVHSATWDSLLGGDGIVKVYWDDTPEYSVSFHTGLSEEERALLVEDEDVEVLQASDGEPLIVDGISVPTFDVKIKRLKSKGRTVVESIAPEDYMIDGDATECQDARFQAHRRERTRSQLIEMGFDRDVVEGLGKAPDDTQEGMARDDVHDNQSAADPSMEIIDLYECYLRVDIDGDGVAETVRVFWAGHKDGGELLTPEGAAEPWEVWEDETPFYSIPCDPVPHRWDSRSIADETMDVQRVKTVLLRQFLDNIYASNNPQRFATGKIINPEALFDPAFGQVIFGEAGASLENASVPMVAADALQAIAYQDQVIANRTGMSRQARALDPDALQNQTAEAVRDTRDASYSQIELVARNQAELGWKPVFRAILKLEIKHRDVARVIRLRGKFVAIDPRHWNADMDISINVGLGTGSRDRDMAMLNVIQQDQMLLIAGLREAGFGEKALEMLPYLHNTLERKAESAGIRSPEMFFPEVTEEEIAQGKQILAQRAQQPNPEVLKEQAKAETQIALKKMDVEAQGEKERLQAQFNTAEKEMAARLDAQVEAIKAEYEGRKMELEYQFKYAQLAQQREIELLKIGLKDRTLGEGEDATTVTVDHATDAVMEGMQKLGEMVTALSASLNAPTEIVRDPATGRAMGTRKVVN